MRMSRLSGSSSTPNFTSEQSMESTELGTEMATETSMATSFFSSDFKRHDDLKKMLESSKDSLKLEAMRRIVGMVAKGKQDVSELFPSVVKNVVSKNLEIKKLVYVYLTRYAEQEQDVALLSISTFQRALKDPNQLIRASALRVLSSIRVPVIVPIVMLAIKEASVDMSAFVRKTAAHAIPKLHDLDSDQKDELVSVIEKLMADRTTLVVGSAIMAFEEVCPERIDLVHLNYRKLCNLVADVEEWGQVVIVNMLTRYARTQFVDPNIGFEENAEDDEEDENDINFYDDDDDDDEDSSRKKKSGGKRGIDEGMDPDHRLLLRCSKPLLQSRNAAVVMAVAQLYHHLAPRPEVQCVAKAMIRLLRSHREVQTLVLSCIATMTSEKNRSAMFEPFLRNFFVRQSDAKHVKDLKLQIITNMANESNIGVVLREFQSYITSEDKSCVCTTIQSIGACAARLPSVTDSCLSGLLHLLSSKDESVVAEAVVVVKNLLQTRHTNVEKSDMIQMARLLDSISIASARSAIVWLIGEHCNNTLKDVAPDVLRQLAKSFGNEEEQVKMQVINLAAKLAITQREHKTIQLLAQYIFNLAKYDFSYDLRDRTRLIRALVRSNEKSGEEGEVNVDVANVFFNVKPAPSMGLLNDNREQFQIGSLSHFLGIRAKGYKELPPFPEVPPNPGARNVEVVKAHNPWEKYKRKEDKFYEDDGDGGRNNEEDRSSDEEESEDSSSDSSNSSSSEDSGSNYEASSETDRRAKEDNPLNNGANGAKHKKVLTMAERKVVEAHRNDDNDNSKSSDNSYSSSSESSDESSSEEQGHESKKEVVATKNHQQMRPRRSSNATNKPKSNVDLLLDLADDSAGCTSTTTTTRDASILSPSAYSTPNTTMEEAPESNIKPVSSPALVPYNYISLLNKMDTRGQLEAKYRFTRSVNAYSDTMVSLELILTNIGNDDLNDIKVGTTRLGSGMNFKAFDHIEVLKVSQSVTVSLGIDFNDTMQTAAFDLVASSQVFAVEIVPLVGELVRGVHLSSNCFSSEQNKLRGMNECRTKVNVSKVNLDEMSMKKRVFETCNVALVPTIDEDNVLKFAATTLADESLLLLSLVRIEDEKEKIDNNLEIIVNCSKMVIGTMMSKALKQALEASTLNVMK